MPTKTVCARGGYPQRSIDGEGSVRWLPHCQSCPYRCFATLPVLAKAIAALSSGAVVFEPDDFIALNKAESS